MSPPRLFQPAAAQCSRLFAAVLNLDLAESRAAEARFARRIEELQKREARLSLILKARDARLAVLGVHVRPRRVARSIL